MWNKVDSDAHLTLLIGLGGFGSRVVDEVYGRVKDSCDVAAFVVDNDIRELGQAVHVPQEHRISIGPKFPATVRDCLARYRGALEWFPTSSEHTPLLSESMDNCQSIRIVGRLAYEMALTERRFDVLMDTVDEMAECCVVHKKSLRIFVVSSLFGGVSSSTFIQVALCVKEHVSRQFPALDVKLYGEFLYPDTTAAERTMDGGLNVAALHECANAYAALKELNAINERCFHKTAPIELTYGLGCGNWQNSGLKSTVDILPYDYCFLYHWDRHSHYSVVKSIEACILPVSAAAFNEEMERAVTEAGEKGPDNMYGTMQAETLPQGSVVLDSKIVRSVISKRCVDTGKRLLLVCAPAKVEMDTTLLPPDTTLIEKTDSSCSQTTIIEFRYGMKLSELERFRYGSGEYHRAYRSEIARQSTKAILHLHKDWYAKLPDIGAPADAVEEETEPTDLLPQEKPTAADYVFISYSTVNTVVANQTKRILETNGISCWMAPQSIPAGSDYASEIPKAIGQCGAFLLVLSESSQKSPWVPKEVGLAIGRGKIVIPFHIDNAAIDETFNFYLTNSQRISAYNRMAEAYQELLKRLRDILPG